MEQLSEKAQVARRTLQDAAAEYQKVVEEVLEHPRGEFVERLRHAEEKVSDAALRWALEYAEGAQPAS
jgi:hypothetical protein